MAIFDDIVNDSAPLDVRHRGQSYRIYYKPLAIDDVTKVKLDKAVDTFGNRATGDFTGLNPLLLDVISDWEFDRIVRDAEGRPLAIDGTVLVNRDTQAPKLERMPVDESTIARVSVFLKMDMMTAIVNDINGSAGNMNGTSDTTPQVGNSEAAPAVPTNAGGQTSVPLSATASGQTNLPPVLVTVPSLESQRNMP